MNLATYSRKPPMSGDSESDRKHQPAFSTYRRCSTGGPPDRPPRTAAWSTRNLTASLCSWTAPSWRHSRNSRTAAPASQAWYSLLRQVSMSLMEAMVRIASSRSSVNRSSRLRREEHRGVWVSRAPPPESNRNGIPHPRRRDLGHAMHMVKVLTNSLDEARPELSEPLYQKAIRELLGLAVEVALLASCNEARPFLDEMVRGNKRAGSG